LDPWLEGHGFEYMIPEVAAHEADDAWWDPLRLPGREDVCVYGGVHATGWYDVFMEGGVDGFEALQARAPDARCRGQQWLVVTPGGHCDGGEYAWPNPTSNIASQIAQALYYSADGRPVPAAVQARVNEAQAVTFYVLGSDRSRDGNYWTTRADWPPSSPLRLYLSADGRLVEKPPAAANASRTWSYDPADPPASLGGSELALPCGPRDLRAVEDGRVDVLVFASGAVPAPTALVGRLSATLWVSTDRVDTDVVVRVADVYPDGRAMLLQEGIVRLRWRLGGLAPILVTPGEVVQVEVSLTRSAYVISEGHAVRVSVAGASAPRWAVNPNHGRAHNDTSGPLLVARTTVYMDAARPSHVTFPLVDLADLPRNFDP
jgi:uncharacterized protein